MSWNRRLPSLSRERFLVELTAVLLMAGLVMQGCGARDTDAVLENARHVQQGPSEDIRPDIRPPIPDSPEASESACDFWRYRSDQQSFTTEGIETVMGPSGDMVVLGRFSGNIDLDPGAGRDMASSRSNSIFLVSIDGDSGYQWGHVIGPNEHDGNRDDMAIPGTIAVTPNGDIVVSGAFRGTIDLDPGAGVIERSAADEGAQFVARLSPDGVVRWDRMFHSPCTGAELEVAVADDDTVYVAGSHEGTLRFDDQPDGEEIQSRGGRDLFMIRLDEAGDIVWVRSVGGFGNEEPTAVAVSSDGAILVGGIFSTPLDFDPGGMQVVDGSGVDRRVPLGVQDAFVLSLDAHGAYRWTRSFGGVDSTVTISDLAAAPHGGGVATGNFRGELRTSQAQDPLATTGRDENIFTVRIDGQGELEWTNVEEWSGITSVAVTTEEAVIVHGEGHLLSLNPDGTHRWQQFVAPENATDFSDEPSCTETHIVDIAQIADGGVALAGWFSGELELDRAEGATTMTSIGSMDALFLELDRNGDLVETMTLGRPGLMNTHAINVMADGSVMVSGTFRGTVDFDPGLDIEERTAAGSSDAFVSKIAPTGRLVWIRTIDTEKVWALDIGVSGSGSSVVSGEFALPPALSTAWRGPRRRLEDNETIYAVVGLAPNGNVRWGRDFVSDPCEPGFIPRGNVVERDGTVTLVGTFWNGTEDPLDVEGTPLVALGEQDVAVVRLDPHGAVQWVSSVGMPGCEFLPTDLWITDDGTVVVTGTHTDDDEESLQHFGASLTPRGSLRWLRVFPAADEDDVSEFLVGADGSIYFFGHISRTVDIDPGPEVELHTPDNNKLIMIGLDADGERRHLQFLNADSDEGGYLALSAAALGSDNGPLVLGEHSGPVDLDSGERLLEHRPVGGGRGLYYLRLNSDLTFNWAGVLDCFESGNARIDAFFTSPGGVIVTGIFDGAIDLDPTARVDSRPANEMIDRFIVSLQPNGDVTWAGTYPASYDILSDIDRQLISIAPDESIVLSGSESIPIDDEELSDHPDASTMDPGVRHFFKGLDPTGTELWTLGLSSEPETVEVGGLVAIAGAAIIAVRYVGEIRLDMGGSDERRFVSGEPGLLLFSVGNDGRIRWVMTSSLNEDSSLCSTEEPMTPGVNGPPPQLPQWHMSERPIYDMSPFGRWTCDDPSPTEIAVLDVDDADSVRVKVHTVRRMGEHPTHEKQGVSYRQLAKQVTTPSAFDDVLPSSLVVVDPHIYGADVKNQRVLRLTSVDIERILTEDMSPDLGIVPESGRQTKVRAALTTPQGEASSNVLNHANVIRVVNGHIQAIINCYETALSVHPHLSGTQRTSGRIEFRWTINEEGGTEEVEVRSSTLQAPGVESCITSIIQDMEFPVPSEGPVMITFPFNFEETVE